MRDPAFRPTRRPTRSGRLLLLLAGLLGFVPGAPPIASASVEGPPQVVSTGVFVVAGQRITLDSITGEEGIHARGLTAFIASRGGVVRCEPVPSSAGMRCRTPDGVDLAEAALFNGGARATATAPPAYQAAEAAARQAGRGIWAAGASGTAQAAAPPAARPTTPTAAPPAEQPVRYPLATSTPDAAPSVSAGFYDPSYPGSWDPPAQHLGIDLPVASGTDALSPVTGRVVANRTANPDPFRKYLVIRDAATGAEHVLGHIDSGLADGAPVSAGDPVGKVVAAGTGPHLHWGVNTRSVQDALDVDAGWGWGRAPVRSTRAEAEAKGWIDPLSLMARSPPAATPPAPAASAPAPTAAAPSVPAPAVVPPQPRLATAQARRPAAPGPTLAMIAEVLTEHHAGCQVSEPQEAFRGRLPGSQRDLVIVRYGYEGCTGNDWRATFGVFEAADGRAHSLPIVGEVYWPVEAVRVTNGTIEVSGKDYGPDDPRCCPSINRRVTFNLRNDRIVLDVASDVAARSRTIEGQLIVDGGTDPATGSRLSMVFRSGRYASPCEITPSAVEQFRVTVIAPDARLLAATNAADYTPFINAGVEFARRLCPAIRSCWEVATFGNPLQRGSGGMSTRCETNEAANIEVSVVREQSRWTRPCGNCQIVADNEMLRATVTQNAGQASIRSIDDSGLRGLRSEIAARQQREAIERARSQAEQRWGARWDAILASSDPIPNLADLVRHNRAATIQRLSRDTPVLLRFGDIQFQDGTVFFSHRQAGTNIYADVPQGAFTWDDWNRAIQQSTRAIFGFLVTCRIAPPAIAGLREGQSYVVVARLVSLTDDGVLLDCRNPRPP